MPNPFDSKQVRSDYSDPPSAAVGIALVLSAVVIVVAVVAIATAGGAYR